MKYAVLVDIINTGITVPEIRDEIYMQIMRQTNISKPPKSSERY